MNGRMRFKTTAPDGFTPGKEYQTRHMHLHREVDPAREITEFEFWAINDKGEKVEVRVNPDDHGFEAENQRGKRVSLGN